MSRDIEKAMREEFRWYILDSLDKARPGTAKETILTTILHDPAYPVSRNRLRKELDYLNLRELIKINKTNRDNWESELTRHGIDLCERTIKCEDGIARPEKFW